jgi:hypothetical protein
LPADSLLHRGELSRLAAGCAYRPEDAPPGWPHVEFLDYEAFERLFRDATRVILACLILAVTLAQSAKDLAAADPDGIWIDGIWLALLIAFDMTHSPLTADTRAQPSAGCHRTRYAASLGVKANVSTHFW